jgi:hypothetical protein
MLKNHFSLSHATSGSTQQVEKSVDLNWIIDSNWRLFLDDITLFNFSASHVCRNKSGFVVVCIHKDF